MNYEESIKYVHAIPKFVRPLGNVMLGGLLVLLGNPQNNLKFIHVAGTNGKGSVCSMTAEILKQSGYKTGLFTSPYIEIFNERIQIDGELIQDSDLADCVTAVADIMEENNIRVSEFAFITAVALKYFSDNNCDIVVLETGMGGRLDATNIIPSPICSVLTSISLEHTQYLGDTLEQITLEKCGIIKPCGVVVSAPNTMVSHIISQQARRTNADLILCDTSKKTKGGFIYKDKEYSLGLLGHYQAENASVVLELVKVLRRRGYSIDEDSVVDGLKSAKWQARYEFVTPDIVIDGGHNIDGIRALKRSLAAENRPITLVMAMMGDKDCEACVREISDIAENIVATELNIPRAMSADGLKKIFVSAGKSCEAEVDVKSAIAKARRLSGVGLVCICGSLYLAGEAKKIIKGERLK